MISLKSYLQGRWVQGNGTPQPLHDPTTGARLAETSADGLDLDGALQWARREGGNALRAMTLAERGALLAAMAKQIHTHRAELFELGVANGGNTRSDAKFDVDGASATLKHFATLSEEQGDARWLVDGDSVALGLSPRLAGRHVFVPRHGVALLINAFNFPGWGFGEKAACALLAGMPIILKPATSTALVAHRIVELVADLLPAGALTAVFGSAHGLPALLSDQDLIAFTGSSDTALKLRALPRVQSAEVKLNVEADSLNSAVLGPDQTDGDSDTYDAFLRDVVKEMTQKAGQKCTAIRRIFVPHAALERVRDDLADRLSEIVVGHPASDGVRMGPLATQSQKRDVSNGIDRLKEEARVVVGDGEFTLVDASTDTGAFVPITLFEASDAGLDAVHDREVFGPVATLLPIEDDPAAIGALVARGRGALVSSIYSDDRNFTRRLFESLAPYQGRLCLTSKKIANKAPSPGLVLPGLVHGGPGRAGGGEELGGWRGVALYSQRVALQGDRALIDKMLDA